MGRNKEVGEKTFVYSPQVGMCTGVLLNTCLFAGSTANIVNNFYQYGTNTQVTRSVFDKNTIGYFSDKQLSNLRNRNAYIEYLEDGNNLSSGTYFSYDLLGNVKTLWQYSAGLDRFNNQGYKRIDYSYDLVSGNTNQVSYQKGEIDQFYHQYVYDLDDRLTAVKTSKDGEIWQQDASYKYLKHGPMARKVLGEFAVQGVDMAYTINGWLKNVNSDAMDAEHDMGADAALNGENSARDAFGFSLHYFDGDFKSIDLSKQNLNVSAISGFTGSDLGQNRRNLFNGNISAMVTTLPFKNNYQSSGIIQAMPMATVYQYDQLNRLAEVRVFENYNTNSNNWGMNGYNGLSQYAEQFEYDANGNITHLKRNGHQIGATMPMDDLSYNYLVQNGRLISNKLYSVDDGIAGSNYTNDIDDQANFNNNLSTLNTANNYGYDDLGNLIRDNAEEIAEIKWNLNGKIAEIKRTTNSQKPDLEFGYDAFGRRQYKLIKPKDNTGNIKPMKDWIKNWYICDVDGNVMANYEQSFEDNAGVFKEKLKVTDHAIYGSERLGNCVKDEMLATISYSISGYNSSTGLPQVTGALTQQTFTLSTSNFNFVSGNKNYELTNHLSNVLAVVQDRKLPIDDVVYSSPGVIDYYLPVYNSFGMYYAFGASISEKGYLRNSAQVYKFGFNGVENENTNVTQLDLYSTDFRMYDSRLGRWLSIDRVVKVFESPYCFSYNSPIGFNDPSGLDPVERWSWLRRKFSADYKVKANEYAAVNGIDEKLVSYNKVDIRTEQDFAEVKLRSDDGYGIKAIWFWDGGDRWEKAKSPWYSTIGGSPGDEELSWEPDWMKPGHSDVVHAASDVKGKNGQPPKAVKIALILVTPVQMVNGVVTLTTGKDMYGSQKEGIIDGVLLPILDFSGGAMQLYRVGTLMKETGVEIAAGFVSNMYALIEVYNILNE